MRPSDPDGDPDVPAPDVPAPDRAALDPNAPEADHRPVDALRAVGSVGSVFDPDTARLWLSATASPDAVRALPSALTSPVASLIARAHDDTLPEVLAELVDHASEADLFGGDRRVTLWIDRDPAGRVTGWHVTVELTGDALHSPDGHRLRLAGTWAPPWTLWSSEDDPSGAEGLVTALRRVAVEADDTLSRSVAALSPGGIQGARGR